MAMAEAEGSEENGCENIERLYFERATSTGDEPEESGAPSCLDPKAAGSFLEVGINKLEAKYIGQGAHSNDVGTIQADSQVPRERSVYYFECTVVDSGSKGCIGVGFGPPNVRRTRQPGWESGSYGYHGDDGRKYHASGRGEDFGPSFGTGDTVGAGINLDTGAIFFTKNGRFLGNAFSRAKCPLVPTIGLHSPGEVVRLNFGSTAFAFNVSGYEDEHISFQEAWQRSFSLSYGSDLKLAASFLAYAGCNRALEALEEESGSSLAEATFKRLPSSNLEERGRVRRAILNGRHEEARAIVRDNFPEEAAQEARFPLAVLTFIEQIRKGDVDAAVCAARTDLAPFRFSGHHQQALRQVLSLLVYERPEQSRFSGLLSGRHRAHLADSVNRALLRHSASFNSDSSHEPKQGTEGTAMMDEGMMVRDEEEEEEEDDDDDDDQEGEDQDVDGEEYGERSLSEMPRPVEREDSPLEWALRHLAAGQRMLREMNGNQGLVFRLRDSMLGGQQ